MRPAVVTDLTSDLVDNLERLVPGDLADFPVLAAAIDKLLPRLTDQEKLVVASLVVGTCPVCHETALPCHCWNDE